MVRVTADGGKTTLRVQVFERKRERRHHQQRQRDSRARRRIRYFRG
jgi:hypothetical protein